MDQWFEESATYFWRIMICCNQAVFLVGSCSELDQSYPRPIFIIAIWQPFDVAVLEGVVDVAQFFVLAHLIVRPDLI